jgi:hypothetical protein
VREESLDLISCVDQHVIWTQSHSPSCAQRVQLGLTTSVQVVHTHERFLHAPANDGGAMVAHDQRNPVLAQALCDAVLFLFRTSQSFPVMIPNAIENCVCVGTYCQAGRIE